MQSNDQIKNCDKENIDKFRNFEKLTLLPTGKPNISFSEFSDWSTCSFRHFLKNIKKIDLNTPGPALDFGTAVHAACEDYIRTREMKLEIAIDKINEAWKKNVDNEKYHDNLDEYIKGAEVILSSVPEFMNQNFKNWEFIDAEHQLFEKLESNAGIFRFKGYIDGVIRCDAKRGKKKVLWLIDWKTSTSGWRREQKQDPIKRMQLIFYKKFWCDKTGDDPKNVRCTFIIFNRTGKFNKCIEKFDVSVGPTTTDRAIAKARDMLTSMCRGTKLKNRFGCKWCDYWGTKHCDSWTKLY